MWGFELSVILAMIGVNSVFAGYELALASVSLARLQMLVEEGRRGARDALAMKRKMEASLAVVQLGITLVGAIAAAVGGAGAEENIAPVLMERLAVTQGVAEFMAIALVVAPLTVVTIIFGELVPKVFALRRAESLCLFLSPFMRLFSYSVRPAVWLLEKSVVGIMTVGERLLGHGGKRAGGGETVELRELRASAALARASRLIGRREEGIILGAAEMRSMPVREIMLPAEHICALAADASLAEALVAAHLDMHTRFPVVERKGDPQTIIGYVNVKDMIAALHINPADPSLRAIVRALPSFGEEQPVAECLERLIREHTHIALVRDTAGRVTGMVSIEDIFEELVGELGDEYDRLPAHVAAAGASWVVGGGVGLARLRELSGLELAADAPPGEGVHTVNDWVAGHLGREVRGGDVVERGGVRVLVRKVRRKKVQEAQVVPQVPRS